MRRCLTKLNLTNCGVGEDGKRDLSKEVLFNNIIFKVALAPNDNGKGKFFEATLMRSTDQ
jgi:hypothetical protein